MYPSVLQKEQKQVLLLPGYLLVEYKFESVSQHFPTNSRLPSPGGTYGSRGAAKQSGNYIEMIFVLHETWKRIVPTKLQIWIYYKPYCSFGWSNNEKNINFHYESSDNKDLLWSHKFVMFQNKIH